MILYRPRPSTNAPFSSRLKLTRSPCGHPAGPPETEVGEALCCLGLDTALPKSSATNATRHLEHNFLRVHHHKYLDAGCAQRCGALATQLSAKNFITGGRDQKETLHPRAGCRKSFYTPQPPIPGWLAGMKFACGLRACVQVG